MDTKYSSNIISKASACLPVLTHYTKTLIVFVMVSLFSQNLVAQDSKSTEPEEESKEHLFILPFENALDFTFRPLHAYSPNGPRLHVLEGDPKSGPSITVFRYSKNYSGSGNLHNHTFAYRLFLIEGKMKHWNAEGSEETATVLNPGSYIYQPADEFHAANCLTERCTAFVLFDGPIETNFPSKTKKTNKN